MTTMSAEDFRRAACRGADPEIFHPIGRESHWDPEVVKLAKALCGRCPVKRQCDSAASSGPAPQGIIAGKTPSERREARREAERKALLRELLIERSGPRRKLYKERVSS